MNTPAKARVNAIIQGFFTPERVEEIYKLYHRQEEQGHYTLPLEVVVSLLLSRDYEAQEKEDIYKFITQTHEDRIATVERYAHT